MSKATKIPAPLIVQNTGRWLGNDGAWSTFDVHAGTPSQRFNVLPSFDGQTVYLPVDEDCLPNGFNVSNCGASRGVEVFNSKAGVGFQKNASSTWKDIGVYKVRMGTKYGLKGNGYIGYDTVGLSISRSTDVISLEKQVLASYTTPDYWQGRMGLSKWSMDFTDTDKPLSLLGRLKKDGYIPSLSFGYQAGAPYRQTGVTGSLVLGGYDRSRRSDNTLQLSSETNLFVGVQGISSTLSNGTTTILLDTGILATIDSNVPEFWLPPAICDKFASAFALTYHPESDRYLQTGATRQLLKDHASILSLTLGLSVAGGQTISIEMPLPAFDHQATYPIFASPTNYFPLRRAANDSMITLGRTFLQETYISADWERDVFNISQAIFSASMPKPELVTIDPLEERAVVLTSEGSNKLSTGLLVGIIGGAIALLLLLGGLGWWCCSRRHKGKNGFCTAGTATQEVAEVPKYSFFLPPSPEKIEIHGQIDVELEGRIVGEMPAPQDSGRPNESQKYVYSANAAELDCSETIYELPSETFRR